MLADSPEQAPEALASKTWETEPILDLDPDPVRNDSHRDYYNFHFVIQPLNLYSVYPKWLVAISVAAKVVNAIDPRREHRQFTLHNKRQEHQFKYQFE